MKNHKTGHILLNPKFAQQTQFGNHVCFLTDIGIFQFCCGGHLMEVQPYHLSLLHCHFVIIEHVDKITEANTKVKTKSVLQNCCHFLPPCLCNCGIEYNNLNHKVGSHLSF